MPDPAAILPQDFNAYIALMVAGFIVAVLGHMFRSRWVVAVGVITVFLAVLLFPLALQVFEDEPDPPPGPVIEP